MSQARENVSAERTQAAMTGSATRFALLLLLGVALSMGACAKQQPAASTAVASPTSPPLPEKIAVRISIQGVSVTTSGPPILRLGFAIQNTSKDPVQCDPSEFSLQLANGATFEADTSADDICDPDSIDPGTSGKATMFFDLNQGYSGPVTLVMTSNGAIIGKGVTQLQ
jgi:hypothetical protein